MAEGKAVITPEEFRNCWTWGEGDGPIKIQTRRPDESRKPPMPTYEDPRVRAETGVAIIIYQEPGTGLWAAHCTRYVNGRSEESRSLRGDQMRELFAVVGPVIPSRLRVVGSWLVGLAVFAALIAVVEIVAAWFGVEISISHPPVTVWSPRGYEYEDDGGIVGFAMALYAASAMLAFRVGVMVRCIGNISNVGEPVLGSDDARAWLYGLLSFGIADFAVQYFANSQFEPPESLVSVLHIAVLVTVVWYFKRW